MRRECECGNPRAPRAKACDSCIDIERQRKRAESTAYQLLAAMRHMDWSQMVDLLDVTGIERVSLSSRLNWLVHRGEVEQRRVPGLGWQYRVKQRRAA